MTRLLLTRHGETLWNREGRIQGWAATDLSDRGRREATAMGAWLADEYDVDRIVSSDLERTRETTAHVREAAARPLPDPTFDANLRERGFGIYQGFLVPDVFERFPDHDPDTSLSALDIDPLNGESIDDLVTRADAAWDSITETATDGETTLVVTHGGILKVLVARLTDRSLETVLSGSSHPNCAVSEIRLDGEDSELVVEARTDWRAGTDLDGDASNF